jgi:hypothetical protein
MAVTARDAWTDGRLDEFKENVNERFDRVDQRFDRVDADIRELRGDVKALGTRLDAMQQTMIIGFVSLFAAIVAAVIGGAFAVLALG